MSELELQGKTALVTGASKGIGKASALKLASMGANIAVNYFSSENEALDTVKEVKSLGVDAFAVQANVGKLDEVNSMISAIVKKFEKIDILINNAGIIQDGLLLRMSDEAWSKVIDTNLNGTFYCSRAAIKLMFKSRWGRIINIGSVVGLRGNVGQTNYSASKAAINGFTFALAKEVATRNITVNTITPGYINTDTVEVLSDKQKDAIMGWIPMQKFGEVEDISNMVGYLSSNNAKYITGQTISIDGGMAI
ncbi:MAG: 3-oxoacyl-[acyl-carrier-protein] reductase [Gammaproteobacteria bacterium]|nr:3-oxoacyl-[acyl-carrier-protein] reductase [Gammaproteobacteria bacterium]MBI80359.1 3-oxoacyl-[acyl-carrier-protein] reductase [Gammaproteobacteria bacterium]